MKRTKVNIDGMSFFVVGSDDETYVREMARELNERIENVRVGNFRLNQVQSLVLMGLNLLDEKNKAEMHLDEISQSNPEKGLTKEFLEEREKREDEIKQLETENTSYETEINKLKTKLADQEVVIKENSAKLNGTLNEQRQLKSKIEELEKELEMEKEKNFESQKIIVDLNKEISVLSGNEEA